jgi:hypothetical protein
MKKLILLAALDFVLAPGATATGSPSCCRAPLLKVSLPLQFEVRFGFY